jgi:hypothetical protein
LLEALIKKLPWQKGRQDSGYGKIKIWQSWWLKSDCYLIYYPEGSSIPEHTDPTPGYRHNRFNIELVKPEVGGEFVNGFYLKFDKRDWKRRAELVPGTGSIRTSHIWSRR